MAGTLEGGRKAAETIKARYGEDFYNKVGKMGGRISRGGGFTNNPELAREAGRKGGSVTKDRYHLEGKGAIKKKSWWQRGLEWVD